MAVPPWRPDGPHGGHPCLAWRSSHPAAHTRHADDPLPTCLWVGPGGIVRPEPPLSWLGSPRRGWRPFRAQVCPDCGKWRAVPVTIR